MNGPAPDPDKEQEEDIPREGDGYLFAGIELHAKIVDRDGRPGIDFSYRPAAGDRKIPEEFLEFNQLIEEGCRLFFERFPDVMGITRFLRAVEKDGDSDRCWYRIVVIAREEADGRLTLAVSDSIDPAFIRADPHVKGRAKKVRAWLQSGLMEMKGKG